MRVTAMGAGRPQTLVDRTRSSEQQVPNDARKGGSDLEQVFGREHIAVAKSQSGHGKKESIEVSEEKGHTSSNEVC